MSDEEKLEELRRKKLQEIQQQVAQQQIAETQKQDFEARKYQIMRKILSQEGRQRLENIRIVKPEFEFQLIQLAKAGRLRGPLSDAAFKKLLEQLSGKKKDFKIKKFDQTI